jgi:hypothetical protein
MAPTFFSDPKAPTVNTIRSTGGQAEDGITEGIQRLCSAPLPRSGLRQALRRGERLFPNCVACSKA